MFDYFISLGWFCGTAGSLSKHGFRSSSGPFDWYFSNSLKSVLYFIETDFSDFLLRRNLEVCPENPKCFEDTKYHLLFNHEITRSLDEDYEDIYKKYARRIDRFREKIKKPTCFIRAVYDENELYYITDNHIYIKKIIKKGNPLSEIIFLIPQWIKMQSELQFPFFVLNIERYKGDSKESLRAMLDNNNDIVTFLQSNITIPNLVSNLKWDLELELEKKWKFEMGIVKYRYDIAIRLLNGELDASLIPRNIVIYGAGNIGKAFFNKCKEICHVECFIDAWSNECEYNGIPILPRDRINEIVCNNIIVTPSYDMVNIEAWFKEHYQKADLIMIDTLFKKVR